MRIFSFLFLAFWVMNASAQNIEIIKLKSRIFNNIRSVRVYLPPEYFNSEMRFPVLYMNDGVASFHAYHLGSLMDSLISNNVIPPMIIVGIDNGGSTEEATNPIRDRANEYLPWPDSSETITENKIQNPQGNLYPSFLFNEIMPVINNKYRTKTGQSHTGLGGASYGALISLYTAIHHTNKIGFLLLESPSLYVDNQHILKEYINLKDFPKTYIGIGTKEGNSTSINIMAVNDAKKLAVLLNALEKQDRVMICVEDNATHSFDSFARRFPNALKFLYESEIR